MKTVMVTGASGLIGTEFTEVLLAKGYTVIGTDNRPNSFLGKPGYEFIQANIEDKDKIIPILSGNKIDFLAHLACTVDNDFSNVITPLQEKISSMVDKYLYKAAVDANIKDIAILSTHQVYATVKSREPVRETVEAKPFTDYAKMKYDSEKTFSKAIGKSNSKGIIARLCPIYNKNFCENLMSKIYDPKDGCSYIYGYGDYGFSFCCVYNAVDFLMGILSVEQGITYQGVYNICDTKPTSAKDVVDFLRDNKKVGAVIQKNLGADVIKAAISFGNKIAKTDYRYNDLSVIASNISFDNTKAQRISTFRWKLSNTK
ncbi:MAG: NAD(P)-dependent oxidoreductase [Oscillospiraceae bacterium]|nr:NAD(P)-dependent oxidoreductase [Oscillospiraceae bacterium]